MHIHTFNAVVQDTTTRPRDAAAVGSMDKLKQQKNK